MNVWNSHFFCNKTAKIILLRPFIVNTILKYIFYQIFHFFLYANIFNEDKLYADLYN